MPVVPVGASKTTGLVLGVKVAPETCLCPLWVLLEEPVLPVDKTFTVLNTLAAGAVKPVPCAPVTTLTFVLAIPFHLEKMRGVRVPVFQRVGVVSPGHLEYYPITALAVFEAHTLTEG
jgi:hypothetical protein